jgi:hypothetical protein
MSVRSKEEISDMSEQVSITTKRASSDSRQLWHEPHLDQTQTLWQPQLDEPLRLRALEMAGMIAKRLGNPTFVHSTVEQVNKQSTYSTGWSPFVLGSGDIGLALLYEYGDRCFPGQGWATLTQKYLGIAAAATHQAPFLSSGLFGGSSGMALVLSQASRGGKRYQKTLAGLHQGLCEQVLRQTWRRPEADGGVADHDYDVISGAAGALAYLVSIKQPDESVHMAIEHLLKYLTWLAEPGQPLGGERWYIPPALLPTELHRKATPQGNFNCGLAHGITGPLAALALTWLAGYRYPGLHESIAYLANWVEEHRVNAPWGIDWPSSVPLEHSTNIQDWQNLFPTRSAWCYGAPGISRSLWLAGQALDDEHMCQVAVEAIETVLRRPIATRHLPSPHICHGTSGLLQICLRFANECESTLVREQIPVLMHQLLDAFDPASAFGFCDMDEEEPLDRPDWLTGAAGIAMVLLAASTSVAPDWDRALVIA